MITTLFGIFLLTMLLVVAFAIVIAKDLFAATMLTGIFSLLMAVNFFILDAADVALTEAAVGAGIATVLFLGALALTGRRERPVEKRNVLALVLVTVVTLMILFTTFHYPELGNPNAPIHQHVAPWYLENSYKYTHVPNVVTVVLASFRGYDTLGEVFVVFTAGIGVLSLLGIGTKRPSITGPQVGRQSHELSHHEIPTTVGRLLIPFIILFALYVQFHGDYGPGGGFQAGAILAAGLILYTLLHGHDQGLKAIPNTPLKIIMSSGALLYAAVGLACIVLGANFLNYNVLGATGPDGQHIGIVTIELGVGVTVTGVMLTIFRAFSLRGSA